MGYLYNEHTGSVNWLPAGADTIYASAGGALGWHGPFADKAAVEKFYADNKLAHPNWKAPTGYPGVVGNTVEATTGISPGSLDPLGINNLNWQSWLIRIGEILLGLVLVGVGVSHLTGNSNFISKALKVAK